jgi:hypothetical protein
MGQEEMPCARMAAGCPRPPLAAGMYLPADGRQPAPNAAPAALLIGHEPGFLNVSAPRRRAAIAAGLLMCQACSLLRSNHTNPSNP